MLFLVFIEFQPRSDTFLRLSEIVNIGVMVDDNKMMQLKYYKNIKKYYEALNTVPKSTVGNQKHRYSLEQ